MIFKWGGIFLDLCSGDFLFDNLGVRHIFILRVQIVCSRCLYIPDEFEPFISSRCVRVCTCVCLSTKVCVRPGEGRSRGQSSAPRGEPDSAPSTAWSRCTASHTRTRTHTHTRPPCIQVSFWIYNTLRWGPSYILMCHYHNCFLARHNFPIQLICHDMFALYRK